MASNEFKQYKTELHCAKIVGEINAKEIEALASAGFEGVETSPLFFNLID